MYIGVLCHCHLKIATSRTLELMLKWEHDGMAQPRLAHCTTAGAKAAASRLPVAYHDATTTSGTQLGNATVSSPFKSAKPSLPRVTLSDHRARLRVRAANPDADVQLYIRTY
eukprot:TRINITY_DN2412_c0_g1_i2.p2 TRINITY_DN2412_c0_g1~~TRINITY_DN2412_c0_g1_i2.p2  ORF type:complete len:112 (-),score=18.05 TRINITY_DN2412_c0_g1_i2:3643-3978(-)